MSSSFEDITTLSLDSALRDRVRDLRDEEEFDNYNETIEHLLNGAQTSEDLQVGDVTLKPRTGRVAVFRDGDVVGTISAQGLYESADLPDHVLSGWWAVWRKFFAPSRNGGAP